MVNFKTKIQNFKIIILKLALKRQGFSKKAMSNIGITESKSNVAFKAEEMKRIEMA
jgi:hypothetical protein